MFSCPKQHAVDAGIRCAPHVCRWWEFSGETFGEKVVEAGVGETDGEEVAWVAEIVGDHDLELQWKVYDAHDGVGDWAFE